jgi:hypothetical protein
LNLAEFNNQVHRMLDVEIPITQMSLSGF